MRVYIHRRSRRTQKARRASLVGPPRVPSTGKSRQDAFFNHVCWIWVGVQGAWEKEPLALSFALFHRVYRYTLNSTSLDLSKRVIPPPPSSPHRPMRIRAPSGREGGHEPPSLGCPGLDRVAPNRANPARHRCLPAYGSRGRTAGKADTLSADTLSAAKRPRHRSAAVNTGTSPRFCTGPERVGILTHTMHNAWFLASLLPSAVQVKGDHVSVRGPNYCREVSAASATCCDNCLYVCVCVCVCVRERESERERERERESARARERERKKERKEERERERERERARETAKEEGREEVWGGRRKERARDTETERVGGRASERARKRERQ